VRSSVDDRPLLEAVDEGVLTLTGAGGDLGSEHREPEFNGR
jgi:hypothetical protein